MSYNLNIQKTRINDIKVKPVKLKEIKEERIYGMDLFPVMFSTIFISSKRRSGKTNLIFNILKKCSSKTKTHIIVIGDTVRKDKTWISINDYFEEKDYSYITYESINDEINGNILSSLVETLKEYPEDKDNYIVVLDDISSELKTPELAAFLKVARHYRVKVIISSQYYNDLRKDARGQIEFFILFKNIPIDKLTEIHLNSNISIDFNKFLEFYKEATKEQYNFLYIDKLNDELRHNFNERFNI